MKIAVIGTGISGLGAAWLLDKTHEIVVYEKQARIGGHSHTVDVDYDGKTIPVDTGFIVYNELNYPNLTALFRELKVSTLNTHMSFSVSMNDGALEWCSDRLSTIFAQRSNLARPSFLAMLRDILRFNAIALKDLDSGYCNGLSLEDYLRRRGFGQTFRKQYILPMGAAIWSTSLNDMRDFPAESLIRFFNNHRLLSYKRPQWQTVQGGSRQYVGRIIAPFRKHIRLDNGAVRVSRGEGYVDVTDVSGHTERFDQVIMACHSDEALALLDDANTQERSILAPMRYEPNTVYLHRDPALMPKRKQVWASWNALDCSTDAGVKVSVSYWMNKLQSLDPDCPLFVSLNPEQPPREDLTFRTFHYAHPQFDGPALGAQKRIHEIQGQRNTWFCGAYCGYGFHEDGLASGLAVAERAGGVVRPWAVGRTPQDSARVAAAAA